MTSLFVATLFLGAALIFTLEPMFGKMVLPLLGGAPAVWNTCVVFYQAVLLGGYGYAHLLATRTGVRTQVAVHAAFLVTAALVLPVALPASMPSPDRSPTLWLLSALAGGLAAPLFVLSATAPLLQRWISTTSDPSARDPYFLYAASNAGSLIGLLAYPLLIEPASTLPAQRTLWAAAYGLLGLLVVGCGIVTTRRPGSVAHDPGDGPGAPADPPAMDRTRAESALRGGPGDPADPPAMDRARTESALRDGPGDSESIFDPHQASTIIPEEERTESPNQSAIKNQQSTTIQRSRIQNPPIGERARWLALAAVPSSLLLSVTTYLSTDVAAVPLLWAVPLALYLLSFVFAFASRRIFSHTVLRVAMIALVLPIVFSLLLEITRPGWLLAPLHLIGLFVFALALHTALADNRPHPSRLTEFYLWVALGGVAGGLFNTLVAPLLFTSVAEYPIALAAACLLRPLWKRVPLLPSREDWGFALALAAATLLFMLGLRGVVPIAANLVTALAAVAIFLYVLCTMNAARFGIAVVLILAIGKAVPGGRGEVLHAERTFFGVYRVTRNTVGNWHGLAHGTTFHGGQFTDAARADQPAFYYHSAGPIGQTFEALEAHLRNADVGVVGLGAGGLATYAQPNQRWTFYEIDPAVERIARNTRFFTYLDRCGAACAVVLGDARLSLASSPSAWFRLLILDAFSSDAIPAHLLTREAFALYFDKLEAEGVLAVHISNRHLNLRPLIAALATERSYTAVAQSFRADPDDIAQTSSDWVLVARTPAPLAPLLEDARWITLEGRDTMRVWTDNYSDLLGVLR